MELNGNMYVEINGKRWEYLFRNKLKQREINKNEWK